MRDLVAVQPMYGIANATFLRQHPEMAGSLWSTMVGVFTGGLAIVLAATRASGLERKYERKPDLRIEDSVVPGNPQRVCGFGPMP